ncbi:MAG: hypothetical protein FJ125_07435 [Deltaproteobacteria bacterium]|nr:hypothetical protein [Deltaproteobacteria bacterium]
MPAWLKGILTSRTIWAAILSAVALGLQQQYGWVIPPEQQALLLPALMAVMRGITSRPLTEPKKKQPKAGTGG